MSKARGRILTYLGILIATSASCQGHIPVSAGPLVLACGANIVAGFGKETPTDRVVRRNAYDQLCN